MPERVWDRLLPEQDCSHPAMRAHRRLGCGSRPALRRIGLSRWGFGDRPEPLLEAVTPRPGSGGLAVWQALPPLQTLLPAARERRRPSIPMTGLDQRGRAGRTAWREPPHPAALSPDARDRRQRRWAISVRGIAGRMVVRRRASMDLPAPKGGRCHTLGAQGLPHPHCPGMQTRGRPF